MKLQKHLAYRYKEKKYFKHVLTIPGDTLRELGWKPGANLEQIVENGELVIRPSVEPKTLMQVKNEVHPLISDKKLSTPRGE